jgi:outer membrane protein OmpA-like peptidoglycan-associated protein
MPGFSNKLVLCFCILVLSSQVFAQNIVTGIDGGLHIRGTLMSSNVSNSELAPLLQPFVRHQLTRSLQGEFSVGLGILRGYDYTTRILPVDYRVLVYPFTYGHGRLLPKVNLGDVYAYAGVGALSYAHVEIPRPADPLTVDAGPKVRNTELWTFSDRLSLQVPFGIGTAIHLDDETQLVLNAGYQLTSSDRLQYVKKSGMTGYFTVSIGLKLAQPSRMLRSRYSGPAQLPTRQVSSLMVTPVPIMGDSGPMVRVDETNESRALPDAVRFDWFSQFPRPEYQDSLAFVRDYLLTNPSIIVRLNGHTDNVGLDRVNDVLAWERAWQVKLWLMRSGIERERVRISSFGRYAPMADSSTEMGRSLNRRVELRFEYGYYSDLADASRQFGKPASTATIELNEVDEGGLITQLRPITDSDRVDLDAQTLADLDALAIWLTKHPHIRIGIVGHADGYGSIRNNEFYSQAWSSKVQAYLLQQGVALDRLETSGKGNSIRKRTTPTRICSIDILRIL